MLRKTVFFLLLLLVTVNVNGDVVSVYPPAHSATYVVATSKRSTLYEPYFGTDPSKSLIGGLLGNSWLSVIGSITNQRFSINLGAAATVRRIYYENAHNNGADTARGVKNFTLYGSNTDADFADTTYASIGNWTQLTTDTALFQQHVALDQANPKYILVSNTGAFKYYSFKFADNYADGNYMGFRRIELQTQNNFALGNATNTDAEVADAVTKKHAVGTVEITGSDTTGAVLFQSGVDALESDSTFVYDKVNKRLGIGTTAPPSRLTVKLSDAAGADSLVIQNSSGVNVTTVDSEGKVRTYNSIATVSNGIPSELATADTTLVVRAITATTLYTPSVSGMFRVSVYLQVTRAATTSSVLGGSTGVTITYTEPDGSVAQSIKPLLTNGAGAVIVPANGNTGNATTTQSQGSAIIYAKAGVAIQYAIGYTSVGATTMRYSAHLKLEAM